MVIRVDFEKNAIKPTGAESLLRHSVVHFDHLLTFILFNSHFTCIGKYQTEKKKQLGAFSKESKVVFLHFIDKNKPSKLSKSSGFEDAMSRDRALGT